MEYGSSSSKREFLKPGIQYQLALGLSGRAEYVMPYFTIGVGMGANVLSRGDMRGFYQILALKIAVYPAVPFFTSDTICRTFRRPTI